MGVCVQLKHLRVLYWFNKLIVKLCYEEFGFIETPYRKSGFRYKLNHYQIDYLTDEEDSYVVAQANSRLDENGRFLR